ncbi:hypothetical protein HDU91_000523 [Kappamyces sp. JEL0680]|nr:hypothetical protein HDU91_000523 [Kappamyces sp. JEL0680]
MSKETNPESLPAEEKENIQDAALQEALESIKRTAEAAPQEGTLDSQFYVDPISLKERIKATLEAEAIAALKDPDVAKMNKFIFDNVPASVVAMLDRIKSAHTATGAKIETVAKMVDRFAVWEHFASGGIIVTTFALASLITYFRLGWFASIAAVWYLCFLYKQNTDRLRYKIKHKTIKEQNEFSADSDCESLEWFNGLVSRLWLNAEVALSQQVKENIDVTLSTIKIPGIDEILMARFCLGSQAPRIESIKTFPGIDDNTYVLDLDLLFLPYDEETLSNQEKRIKGVRNFEVLMEAKLSKIPLPIALREVFFNGQLRVKFQLMTTFPHIRMVDVGFITPPVIDFVLRPLGANVTRVAGLGRMIKDVVNVQINSLLVNPKKLSFDVPKLLNSDAALTEMPVGVLRVIVYEAAGLQNYDRSGVTMSCPSTAVLLGGEEVSRTLVIADNLDPKWNSIQNIVIKHGTLSLSDRASEIRFEVLHHNALISKLLGSTLPLQLSKWLRLMGLDYLEEGPLSEEEAAQLLHEWGSPFETTGTVWKDLVLNRKKAGSLRIDLTFIPTLPLTDPKAPAASSSMVQSTDATKKAPCVVTLVMNQAKELIQGHNGVIECIGKMDDVEVVATASRKRTVNPKWGSKHHFFCPDLNTAEVSFEVHNRNRMIGSCTINLKKALASKNPWYRLAGGGKLSVSVLCRPLDTNYSTVEPAIAKRYDPVGLLRLQVLEARELPMNTVDKASMGLSKLNPFCKLYIQGRSIGSTMTREKSNQPFWNETFLAPSYSTKETIGIDVFDDTAFQDAHLGKIELPIDVLNRMVDGTFNVDESLEMSVHIKNGLRVSKSLTGIVDVWAPLYKKDEHKIEELEQAQEEHREKKQLGFLTVPRATIKAVKGGIGAVTNVTADILEKGTHFAMDPLALLQGNQNGHVHFQFQLLPQDANAVVDLRTEKQETTIPGKSSNTTDRMIGTGILRLKLDSASLPSKKHAYVQVISHGQEIQSTYTNVESSSSPAWYASKDEFISDITQLDIKFLVREQMDLKPASTDPIIGHWDGNFIDDVLGKGPLNLDLRVGSGEVVGQLAVAAIFYPVPLGGKQQQVSDSGNLRIDLVEASHLNASSGTCLCLGLCTGTVSPYIVASLNGVEVLRTRVAKKSTNPRFDQGVDVEVHSRMKSHLLLQVKSQHHFGSDEQVGSVNVPLQDWVCTEPTEVILHIDDSEATLKLTYYFEPKDLKTMSPAPKAVHREVNGGNAIRKLGKGLTTGIGKLGGVTSNGLSKIGDVVTFNHPKAGNSQTLRGKPSVETLHEDDAEHFAVPTELTRSSSRSSHRSSHHSLIGSFFKKL